MVRILSPLDATLGIVNSSRAGYQHKKEEEGKELIINGWSTEGKGKKLPMNWLEHLDISQRGDIAGRPPKAKAKAEVEAEKVAEDGTFLHTTCCGKIVLKKKNLVLNDEEAGSPTMP